MFASVGSALAQLNSVCATLIVDPFHWKRAVCAIGKPCSLLTNLHLLASVTVLYPFVDIHQVFGAAMVKLLLVIGALLMVTVSLTGK